MQWQPAMSVKVKAMWLVTTKQASPFATMVSDRRERVILHKQSLWSSGAQTLDPTNRRGKRARTKDNKNKPHTSRYGFRFVYDFKRLKRDFFCGSKLDPVNYHLLLPFPGVPSNKYLPCPKDFYCTDGFYTCYLGATPVCDSTTTEIATTTTTTEAPWNPKDLCDAATKSTFFENKDDPTCTS